MFITMLILEILGNCYIPAKLRHIQYAVLPVGSTTLLKLGTYHTALEIAGGERSLSKTKMHLTISGYDPSVGEVLGSSSCCPLKPLISQNSLHKVSLRIAVDISSLVLGARD